MSKPDIKKLRKINLDLAKKKIKESINEDNFICQSINSMIEMDKVINLLSKRLREWYSLYNPEFTVSISNNQKFVELIQKKSKDELQKELNVTNSMGADLKKIDINAFLNLAKKLTSLFQYQEETEKYLDELMQHYCPNLKELAGTTIGAKLIEHTGSLKRLVMMPSSTIQILGAEKALFRHLKTGARPPKYGLIYQHNFIQTSKKSEQGKKARALADKLSLCVKMDYFKGEFIADRLKKEIEAKFK
jgi:nucleolar protein 56